MSQKSYQRNTIFQTAVILSLIYIGVPLVLHLFPSDHVHVEEVSNGVQEKAPTIESPPSQAPLSISNILAVLSLVFVAIRHTLELVVLRIPLLLYIPLKHAYLLLAYIVRVIARLLYPTLLPLIYGAQFATAFILIPVAFFRKVASLFYPVYVFVGAACTCGAILGLVARFANTFILSNVFSVDTRGPTVGHLPSSNGVRVGSRSRGRQKKLK